ncbi:MAG: hypothetical protein ACUVSX_13435 [Aggregatilineales bacterium]
MKAGKGRLVVVIMAALLLAAASAASAQSLSVGSANIGASALNGSFSSNSGSYTALFNAGEILTFQVSGAAPAVFQLSEGTPWPLTTLVTSSSFPFVYVYTIPSSTSRLLDVAETGGGTITVAVSCGLPAAAAPPAALPPCPHLQDGRINNNPALDCAAPVAIYTGALDVYGVDPQTGHGYLTLRLSDEEIAAVGTPASNTLLAQAANLFTGHAVSVYALTTGEIQLNTFYADGKPYTVVWPADQPGALYHLDW